MSMEQKAINLKSLTMDELAGVVNLYPWYGAARKELCQRMAGMGGESWGVSQFSDQAMYVGDRGMIAEIMRQGKSDDYADKDLESLLGTYIDEKNVRRTPRRKTKAGRYMWSEVISFHRMTMRKSEERKTMCLFLSR